MEREHEQERIRQEAVARYLKGESARKICKAYGTSERWLRKWVGRQRQGDSDWFVEKSRAPHRVHNKTKKENEKKIVTIRKKLMANPKAQIGSAAIQWQFVLQGESPPGRSVIQRVLTEHNLIVRPKRYEKKNRPYPSIPADQPGTYFEMDLVGPRYIKGDGCFYAVNVMDVVSRQVAINIVRRKNDASLANALIATFERMGLPRRFQMDNMLSLHGSHRYPHSFGLVLRLLLDLRIEPIFIPVSEPWRNGIIERFQNVFDKSFFRTTRFRHFDHLVAAAQDFEAFHNSSHCYSALGGKPPVAFLRDHPSKARPLPNGFAIPDKLVLRKGKIHLIRFIRSDLILDVFGEKFSLPKSFQYAYVTATIHVRANKMHVRNTEDGSEKIFDYPIPQTPFFFSTDMNDVP